jgi:hypothetical protein
MAAPGTQRSSAAEEPMEMSGQEELGESSTTLGVGDFELVKTLGTGRLFVLLSPILSGALQRMNEIIVRNWVKESR